MTRTEKFAAEFTTEHPPKHGADLPNGVMVIVREKEMPQTKKWAYFKCPCGCGEVCMISLQPSHQPHWRLREPAERPTLTPSINSVGFKCQSHYWITNGDVVWC